MSGNNLVTVQIPAEELENVDELVRDGYYGSRSVAIRDIIRRGAAHLRLRFRSVKTEDDDEMFVEMVYMRISTVSRVKNGK
jgi:Arc/MetJ-type ribon-helix-helix transcriptional regulator